MYGDVHQILPSSLPNTFIFHKDIHEYLTRHGNDPQPLSANAELLNKSYLCKGPKMWMELDACMKNVKSKHIFKRQMKREMLKSY